MVAIIPVAGVGSRLRPHTHTAPKPLLHVAGKPILGHILDQLNTVSPERVIFGKRLPLAQHLARLRLADLALDCPPCGSHTTTSDALWAGTPHLAARGDSFSARVSSSLLTAISLPELIVDTTDEYRALALRLSHDRSLLSMLRAKLAANRLSAPLFDSRRFTRHLEAGYQAIWRDPVSGVYAGASESRKDGCAIGY